VFVHGTLTKGELSVQLATRLEKLPRTNTFGNFYILVSPDTYPTVEHKDVLLKKAGLVGDEHSSLFFMGFVDEKHFLITLTPVGRV